MRPRRNSQRAACPCSATSFRNDPGELLPAQIPLCNGYRLNWRNQDERPIEPRDESARRPRTLEASPKYAGQGHVEGTLWRIKGRPDGLSGVVMRLNTTQPDLTITPFPKPGTVGHFTPNRVWIEDANGTVVSELTNPRDSFAGAVLTTKWNELQELYFASYAFWNYFTAPFLLAQPGVEVEEIETHNEDDETWRQLSVIFPPGIPTHSARQTFYFNDKGLLQRLDYATDVCVIAIALVTGFSSSNGNGIGLRGNNSHTP